MRGEQDLEWCLTSAALPVDESWSEGLAPVPGLTVPDPPHPHRFRLGRHFERVLLTWLDAAPGYRLIRANLPVRDGKRTIGEFDFIVETPIGIEHWEAAVKFYLGAGIADRIKTARWFGPNTSDRLDLKLARLTDHQLVLADHPAAAAVLDDLDVMITHRRCFMKGRLFHPMAAFDAGDFTVPDAINPNHERGWWLSLADFQQHFVDAAARFVYLPKSLWLSPLRPDDIEAPLSFWEMLEFLQSNAVEQATHLALVDDRGERSRGFVVTNEWLTRVKEDAPPSPDNGTRQEWEDDP